MKRLLLLACVSIIMAATWRRTHLPGAAAVAFVVLEAAVLLAVPVAAPLFEVPAAT
jgi:hypothetical protein